MVRVYLFTDIPGSGKGWTLAVFATSKQDAANYVKRVDGGGRFVGEVQPGKVDACCGAITENAQIEMERSNENGHNDEDRSNGQGVITPQGNSPDNRRNPRRVQSRRV